LTADALLIILVGVIALSLVLQSLFIWKTTRTAQGFLERTSAMTKNLEQDTAEVLARLRSFDEGLVSLEQIFGHIGENAEEINTMFGARARQVDQLVERLVAVGSKQADKVEEVVNDTVEKFEETTSIIQEDILRPVVEISSLIKGLRTGLDYLFSGKERRAGAERYPEEDLFI
jgi:methyl-accepting chemotaxis protein